jgi:hypothetical protein
MFKASLGYTEKPCLNKTEQNKTKQNKTKQNATTKEASIMKLASLAGQGGHRSNS